MKIVSAILEIVAVLAGVGILGVAYWYFFVRNRNDDSGGGGSGGGSSGGRPISQK